MTWLASSRLSRLLYDSRSGFIALQNLSLPCPTVSDTSRNPEIWQGLHARSPGRTLQSLTCSAKTLPLQFWFIHSTKTQWVPCSHKSIYLSIHLSIHLSIYPSIYLSNYLSSCCCCRCCRCRGFCCRCCRRRRCCCCCCSQPLCPDALPLAVGRGRRWIYIYISIIYIYIYIYPMIDL